MYIYVLYDNLLCNAVVNKKVTVCIFSQSTILWILVLLIIDVK